MREKVDFMKMSSLVLCYIKQQVTAETRDRHCRDNVLKGLVQLWLLVFDALTKALMYTRLYLCRV